MDLTRRALFGYVASLIALLAIPWKKTAAETKKIGLLAYPEFSREKHSLIYHDRNDPVSVAMLGAQRQFKLFPSHWTRYAIVNPGYETSVLFVMVPPPEVGNVIIPYCEMTFIDDAPGLLAKFIREAHPNSEFEDFIGDVYSFRQTPMGMTKSVGSQYEETFERHGVKSRRGGRFFSYSSGFPLSEYSETRLLFSDREESEWTIRIFGCELLKQQLESFRLPAKRGSKYGFVECLEMFVGRNDCRYVDRTDLKV